MKKQTKLHRKILRILKILNCREYLHHFGPKKFKFVHHVVALLLKESLKCSFRRISKTLWNLGIITPTYSALCKCRKRIPIKLWNSLLKVSAGLSSGKIAIDGTGFSRTNPSFHYVKRINLKEPIKRFTKLSALFDLVKKKFTNLKIRVKPRHDFVDAKPLVKKTKGIIKLFGDSAYDAESLHEVCFKKQIQTIIKPRKNVKRGFYRRKQMKNYSEKEYPQRSLIESGFGSLKRKYGGNVSGKFWKSVNSEIYCKAICHNLNLIIN